MEKAAVRHWKDRWDLVARVEAGERRDGSTARRWRQLNALRRMARRYGMRAGDAGESAVWDRWAKLKGAGRR